jgi:hypothetical protein
MRPQYAMGISRRSDTVLERVAIMTGLDFLTWEMSNLGTPLTLLPLFSAIHLIRSYPFPVLFPVACSSSESLTPQSLCVPIIGARAHGRT